MSNDAAPNKSQQRDGIYLFGNFLATFFLAAMIYLINEGNPDSTSTTLDIVSVVVLSYLLMFTVTVIQFRALEAKISFQILFRILLATTFDLSVTYSLFRMFAETYSLRLGTPAGVLGLGALNAASILSFTGMVRESYIFYEHQNLENVRDIAPVIFIGAALSFTFLCVTGSHSLTDSDKIIRKTIIGMLLVLLVAGQQFGIGDPLTKNGVHSEKTEVGGQLSAPELIFILSLSIFAISLFVYVGKQQIQKN